MAGGWFESVAVAQRRAKKRLPKGVYGALIAGSEKGLTVDDNTAAFDELGFAPRVAGLSKDRQLATTVMGQQVSMPVLISPTGVQAVHPDGEVAVARAAAARGAGAVGLIVTLDWSFGYGRDWGSPFIPEKIDLEAALRYAPQVLAKPRWLWNFARSGGIPDLTVPNMVPVAGDAAPTFFGAYGLWNASPLPTWDDVAWLRELWGGPFMLKGVMRVDDAHRAVAAGVTAISVSNHGGNNLDGTPAAIRALPAIADAVGDQVEVLMDGGIRRGSDVAKALALGAKAVLIGRAYLWGLAANGQAGVENVLDVLRDGLGSTLTGLGHRSVADLSRDDLVIPPGFERHLGVEAAVAPVLAHAARR
jgi:pre-mycofactocin synthase